MLTEEESLTFEQARDYHNMMVRLIRQAHLHRFAGMGEPVSIRSVIHLYDEMEDMRLAVSRVACANRDMEVNGMAVSIACRLFSTWNALFAAARGRPGNGRPEMI